MKTQVGTLPNLKSGFRTAVRHGLYPFLLAVVLAVIVLAVRHQWDYKAVYWKTTIFLLAVLIAAEFLVPLSRGWAMTGKSFFRDFRYALIVGPAIGLTKAAVGWLLIGYGESHSGPLEHLPAAAGTVGFLLVFEFLQYWFHRASHAARGPVGRFLWRAHLAHHLPDRVYVLMHAVFHPLNAILSTAIIQVPLVLLGVPPAAVLAATLLIDLQSLVSHFNVDIRGGWFNYLFIGTETHRFHHSADMREAGNFGNTLAVWDLVFGTFRYAPGKVPARLGLAPESEEGAKGANPPPRSENVLEVMAYPFRA